MFAEPSLNLIIEPDDAGIGRRALAHVEPAIWPDRQLIGVVVAIAGQSCDEILERVGCSQTGDGAAMGDVERVPVPQEIVDGWSQSGGDHGLHPASRRHAEDARMRRLIPGSHAAFSDVEIVPHHFHAGGIGQATDGNLHAQAGSSRSAGRRRGRRSQPPFPSVAIARTQPSHQREQQHHRAKQRRSRLGYGGDERQDVVSAHRGSGGASGCDRVSRQAAPSCGRWFRTARTRRHTRSCHQVLGSYRRRRGRSWRRRGRWRGEAVIRGSGIRPRSRKWRYNLPSGGRGLCEHAHRRRSGSDGRGAGYRSGRSCDTRRDRRRCWRQRHGGRDVGAWGNPPPHRFITSHANQRTPSDRAQCVRTLLDRANGQSLYSIVQ